MKLFSRTVWLIVVLLALALAGRMAMSGAPLLGVGGRAGLVGGGGMSCPSGKQGPGALDWRGWNMGGIFWMSIGRIGGREVGGKEKRAGWACPSPERAPSLRLLGGTGRSGGEDAVEKGNTESVWRTKLCTGKLTPFPPNMENRVIRNHAGERHRGANASQAKSARDRRRSRARGQG